MEMNKENNNIETGIMKENLNEEEIRKYCLNCVNKPCSNKGCPLQNNIPNFIHEEDYKKAFDILCTTTVLPAICGRICPHEKQCQGSCIRGIKKEPVSIGKMESIIGDKSIENNLKIKKNIDSNLEQYKVAIIGGGPAGLTCAAFLAKEGISVTIYEKYDALGGILIHGIPEFRLSKNIVKQTVDKILDLGIKTELNKELGKDFKLQDLIDKYDAIFIGIGANIPSKMNIDGEELDGVYGGNTLLEKNNHPNYNNKKVAVIGGGNVAMDTARTIKKLGAKNVYVIYRRSEKEMPAEKKEISEAKEEGIEFLFQTNIIKILDKESCGDNKEKESSKSTDISKNQLKVGKIECIKTELVQKEGEDRLIPVNIKDSNYFIDVDYVVMAIGSKPEEKVIQQFGKNKWGYVQVDENMQTSIPKVFAGGDIVGEKSTVAWASRSGREAANKIIEYLLKDTK